jgi:hypothetical protein
LARVRLGEDPAGEKFEARSRADETLGALLGQAGGRRGGSTVHAGYRLLDEIEQARARLAKKDGAGDQGSVDGALVVTPL